MDEMLTALGRSFFTKEGMTITIGASCFLESDKSFEDALKRAENELYKAKINGKDIRIKII